MGSHFSKFPKSNLKTNIISQSNIAFQVPHVSIFWNMTRINVPSGWKSDAQKRQNSIAKFLCRDRDFLFRDFDSPIKEKELLSRQRMS